ncbi:molybdenum cofactor guanylyltransferase MobA [Rhizobium sp. ACO-34A]|nr:molybdenum cofactor guanylyltransferase MobA [Rhizobium sp. ACO-34A]ATN34694.1 molybdenum cofactor guanylyltransferase MobA [Rhizobium sp. ACO-34A]
MSEPQTAQSFPALVLAGGLSRRMGRDKTIVDLSGQPMIAHVVDRLRPQVSSLAVNAPSGVLDEIGLPVLADIIPGHAGPLAGVLAGLIHTRESMPEASHLLTVPADTPFLPEDLAARMADDITPGRIVVAASLGRIHPVVALWPISLTDDLKEWLSNPDNRKLQSFIAHHPSVAVDFPTIETASGPLDPFFNVNTPDDLARAEQILKERRP